MPVHTLAGAGPWASLPVAYMRGFPGLLGNASDMTVLPPSHILIFCAFSMSRKYKASRAGGGEDGSSSGIEITWTKGVAHRVHQGKPPPTRGILQLARM